MADPDDLKLHEIEFGGRSRAELLSLLKDSSVALNAYAETLFASELFACAPRPQQAVVAELSLFTLGFPDGADLIEIVTRAEELGLAYCPLELGPYLRLKLRDQDERTESKKTEKHRAPPGSITLVSAPLKGDDDFPKGFYLRKMDGVLWLRGYVCSLDFRWSPEDRLAFVVL